MKEIQTLKDFKYDEGESTPLVKSGDEIKLQVDNVHIRSLAILTYIDQETGEKYIKVRLRLFEPKNGSIDLLEAVKYGWMIKYPPEEK